MPTSSPSRDCRRFDELAEEFGERYRPGERPSVQEYVDRLPEMAEEIRKMFPGAGRGRTGRARRPRRGPAAFSAL
jgi:hypothetical protein